MSDPNMGAFRDLLKKAKAVVIAPAFLKGAFVVGASGGNAVAMVREKRTAVERARFLYHRRSKFWSADRRTGFRGGSSGNDGSRRECPYGNSFKLGVDAGVAAGPVGVGAAAASANLSADILSFSRSKGLYGGISLDGAVIAVRGSLNQAYYHKKVTPTDILVRHEVKNPQTACLVRGLAGRCSEESGPASNLGNN